MNLRTENMVSRIRRLPGRATVFGLEYEFKLAGLVALRARAAGWRFQLFTNVAAAIPCDDVVLRVLQPRRAVYFLQLKHALRKDKPVGTQALTSSSGDFSIKKYYEFYKNIREMQARPNVLTMDEDLLFNLGLENMRILIFTNKTVLHHSSYSDEPNEIDNLFLTRSEGRGDMFRFRVSDEEVWNLSQDPVYQLEFLKCLTVFSRQCDVSDLDSLLRQEIEKLFGGEIRDVDKFLRRYVDFLKGWAQDDTQDCLSESTPALQLERILAGEFCERATAATEELVFHDDACAQLRVALRRPGALRVIVSGVARGLRATKLVQVLQRDYPQRWTYVDASILRGYSAAALAVTCRACDVVVLEVETITSDDAAAIKNVVDNSKKVVTLHSEDKPSSQLHDAEMFSDDWTMEHLTHEARERMLDRTIIFQGSLLRLRELQDTWPRLQQECDAALLGALCEGEPLLGAPPPAPDDLYLPRIIEHHSALHSDVLFLRSPSDHLALSDVPETILQKVRHLRADKECRWTLLPAGSGEDAFHSVCSEHSPKNVHWVQRVGGQSLADVLLVWRDTRGNERALVPFVRQATDACVCRPLCAHAHTDAAGSAHTMLLVGEAGTGKTCTLKRMATEARKQAPIRWAVYVQVLAHRIFLRALPPVKDIKFSHVVDLLVEAAIIANPMSSMMATRHCLEAALSHRGAVSVFMDGVDEVSPFFKDKILQLLALLRENTEIWQMWVSSRPELETSLCHALQCAPAWLRPLSREEQVHFLCAYRSNGVPTAQTTTLANEMVSAFTKATYADSSVLSIPLHLCMVAETFAIHMFDESQLIFGDIFFLLNCYSLFMEQKHYLYLTKHDLISSNMENFYIPDFSYMYKECAMLFLMANEEYPGIDIDDFRCKVSNSINMMKMNKEGILWVDKDNAPHFIHFSFAEYFGAQWLNDNRNFDAAKVMLQSLYRNHDNSLVLRFLELMLLKESKEERLPLHEALLTGEEEAVARTLAEGASPNAVDGGSRLALHLAARRGMWRTVQVLLEAGCDPNNRDALLGWTPAQYLDAVHPKHSTKSADYPRAAQLLLRAGADPMELIACFSTCDLRSADSFDLSQVTMVPDDKKEACYAAHIKFSLTGNVKLLSKKHVRFYNEGIATLTDADFIDDRSNIRCKTASGYISLHNALENNDEKDALQLLSCGADVNEVDKDGSTPLHLASKRGFLEVCRIIIDTGGDPNKKTRSRETALLLALENGKQKCAEFLLQYTSDSNESNRDGMTPLHIASGQGFSKIVLKLISLGANVNCKTVLGNTPLHLASTHGQTFCTDVLLRNCANPNCFNDHGNTPLHLAAKQGLCDVTKILLTQGSDVNAKNLLGNTPLFVASENDQLCCMKLLLSYGADTNESGMEGLSPLHIASKRGFLSVAQTLLNVGANVNAKCSKKDSPLHLALENGHRECAEMLLDCSADPNASGKRGITPLLLASKRGLLDVAIKLVNAGAKVKGKDANGDTPLLVALQHGHLDSVDFYLQHGANTDIRGKRGKSTLHFVSKKGLLDVMKKLIAAGADVNRKTQSGDTPLLLALQNDQVDCADWLIQKQANPNDADRNGMTPLHVTSKTGSLKILELLTRIGGDVNKKTAKGDTPLHVATENRQLECVQFLLTCSVNCNDTNNEGNTPLHIACREGYLEIQQILIQSGADVNKKTAKGENPLHLVLGNENMYNVEMLLSYGADINAADKDRRSALHIASEYGFSEIVEILLRHGADNNMNTAQRKTPLLLATESGHLKCVALLQDLGADVHLSNITLDGVT